jgi:hypothetical protein
LRLQGFFRAASNKSVYKQSMTMTASIKQNIVKGVTDAVPQANYSMPAMMLIFQKPTESITIKKRS